ARPRRPPAAPPHSGSPSPGRVELRREIDGGVFQDRVRTLELGVLLAQPLQLFPLACRRQLRAAPLIDLRLPHPLPQRLLANPQVARDVRDRPARLEIEPNGTLAQLIRVLPWSAHRRSISFPQDR